MLRAAIDEARARGDHSMLLFSDIGPSFYARLGFVELPASDWWGVLGAESTRAASDLALAPLEPADLVRVMRAHEDACRLRQLAFLRDLDHWRFVLARAGSFFARLDGSSLERRYVVATRNGAFAGYLIALVAGDTWLVREAGAVGGAASDVAATIRAGVAGALASGCRRVFGWFPSDVAAGLPALRLRPEPRARAIPMVLPLDPRLDLTGLRDPDAAFVPYLDRF
jgi:hypothetical protein